MGETFIDYFELFYLTKTSTEEDLDFEYQQIIQFLNPESHPDKTYSYEEMEEAARQMDVINQAYRTLKDPVLREEYRKEYIRHKLAERQQEKNTTNSTKPFVK